LLKIKDVKENLKAIKDDLAQYIENIIGRSPMVVPMFVYINRDIQDKEDSLSEEEAIVGMTLDEQGIEESLSPDSSY